MMLSGQPKEVMEKLDGIIQLSDIQEQRIMQSQWVNQVEELLFQIRKEHPNLSEEQYKHLAYESINHTPVQSIEQQQQL